MFDESMTETTVRTLTGQADNLRATLSRLLVAEDPVRVRVRLRGMHWRIEAVVRNAPVYVGPDW